MILITFFFKLSYASRNQKQKKKQNVYNKQFCVVARTLKINNNKIKFYLKFLS